MGAVWTTGGRAAEAGALRLEKKFKRKGYLLKLRPMGRTSGGGESGEGGSVAHEEGRDEIADIIHSVVMEFERQVGIFLPAVQAEFADGMDTIAADTDFALFESDTDLTDSVEDMVLGGDGFEGRSFLDEGTEAGGGGVDDDAQDIFIPSEVEQGLEMLVIGTLDAAGFGVIIILIDAVPDVMETAPQAEGGGIDGAVVTGNDIGIEGAAWDIAEGIGGQEGINEVLGGGPLAEDETLIEGAGIEGFVAFADFRGEGGVIVHREMEIEEIFGFCGEDPVLVEPMGGGIGVTVKPEQGKVEGASGDGLFDEGAGHEGDLIEEDAGEGNPLDEGSGGLVFSAEEEETV